MKIAVDLCSLADNFSGIERMALNITKELLACNTDHQYQLFFKGQIHTEFASYQGDPLVEICVLPRKNKLWFYQVTLLRAMEKSDADVFLFLAFPAPFFLRRKRIINTIHDMGCWDCPETMTKKMVAYFRLMNSNSARQSWRLITISEFSKNRILEHLKVPEDRVKVVYLGVSEEMYECSLREWEPIRKKYDLPTKYMMCLSTLEPRKNMKLLVDAYRELSQEDRNDCKLVLAGRKGWKIDELLQQISTEDRDNIHVTGYIDNGDLPYLYRHAEMFVFPSIYEGFGIPPLEAMAVGRPVICSDIQVCQEVLGDHAVYFGSGDKADLKKVLRRYLNCEETWYDSTALVEFSKTYTYQKAAEELVQLLEG